MVGMEALTNSSVTGTLSAAVGSKAANPRVEWTPSPTYHQIPGTVAPPDDGTSAGGIEAVTNISSLPENVALPEVKHPQ
jgi:hypothetical protein